MKDVFEEIDDANIMIWFRIAKTNRLFLEVQILSYKEQEKLTTSRVIWIKISYKKKLFKLKKKSYLLNEFGLFVIH